jgi:hypothetical protein
MGTSARKEPFRRHEANPIITVEDLPYPANTVWNAGAASTDLSDLLVWLKSHDVHSGG